MRLKKILLFLCLVVLGTVSIFADQPLVGEWQTADLRLMDSFYFNENGTGYQYFYDSEEQYTFNWYVKDNVLYLDWTEGYKSQHEYFISAAGYLVMLFTGAESVYARVYYYLEEAG